MDGIQETYESPPRTSKPFSSSDVLTSMQQKSFESIVKTPYASPYNVDTRSRSIESPYTSLGSGRSSYASIKPTTYSSLRAKAVKASFQHEGKSKAVMQALKNLQDKIGTLEIDREKAESNLKCLASETKEYKELLHQKHAMTSPRLSDTSKRYESPSGKLESQLENAQGRCEVLEKQLDYMRKTMQDQQRHNLSPRPDTISTSSSPRYSITTAQQLAKHVSPEHRNSHQQTSPQTYGNLHVATVEESPALEKLNDLERDHLRLTASQNQTENKIKELEEKMREERHCRKLLEDKANQLQNAITQTKNTDTLNSPPSPEMHCEVTEQPKRLKHTGKRKKVARKASCKKANKQHATTQGRQSQSPRSPTHYHLDLANIPFVVGQSTSRSYSVGANVQNVLSIMKSHSRLCNSDNQTTYRQTADGKTTRRSSAGNRSPRVQSPKTNEDLNELLTTLNEEFSQLGEEHRVLVEQLELENPSHVFCSNLKKDLHRIVEKMEKKGKQIGTIRDLIRIGKATSGKESVAEQCIAGIGSQEQLEVITTIRSAKRKSENTKTTSKMNRNLQLLKNVRKLQCTLQKNDLKWE